jgi:hypothetical protein
MSFFLNVVSSVLASIIVILAAGLLSRTARSMLVGALGRLVDIDVETVFRNPREAAPDLRRELERAGRVDLLTGRGSELERETFAGLLGAGAGIRRRPFRLLLPDPRPVGEATDWTADRDKEVARFDPAFGGGVLAAQISSTIEFLSRPVEQGLVQLRLFDDPHVGRIVLTDRVAYFTPYRRDAHSRDCRVIKYRRGGEMYDHLSRLFGMLWRTARSVTPAADPR